MARSRECRLSRLGLAPGLSRQDRALSAFTCENGRIYPLSKIGGASCHLALHISDGKVCHSSVTQLSIEVFELQSVAQSGDFYTKYSLILP